MTEDYLWYRADDIPPGPVAHALIVGTSYYRHLPAASSGKTGTYGLTQLDCGASAGYRFAMWLKEHRSNLTPQLATIRLLLTPSEEEKSLFNSDFASLPDTNAKSVQDALLKWQAECQLQPGNVAILYLCGHGVLESPDQVYVLVHDAFEFPNLENSVSVAPTQQALGTGSLRASIIFVDACQQIPPDQTWDLTGGKKLAPPRYSFVDSRIAAPIYYAASAGGSAYGKIGDGTFFCQALLSCLESRAAKAIDHAMSEWLVSTTSLHEELPSAVEELMPYQQVRPAGWGRKLDIHRLPDPPVLPVELSLVPPELNSSVRTVLNDGLGKPVSDTVFDFVQPVPLRCGKYSLRVSSEPPPRFTERTVPILHSPPVGAKDRIILS